MLVIFLSWLPSYIGHSQTHIRSAPLKKSLQDPYDSLFHLAKTTYEELLLKKNGLIGLPPISPHLQNVILTNQKLRLERRIQRQKLNELISNLSYQIERVSPSISPYLAREISESIIHNTKGLGWPTPIEVASIMTIESDFHPHALSSSGAYGLMQIGTNWRGKLPNSAFTTINGNIKYGIYILRRYYYMFHGNVRAAVLSYNSGDGAYEKGQYMESYWRNFLNARWRFQSI